MHRKRIKTKEEKTTNKLQKITFLLCLALYIAFITTTVLAYNSYRADQAEWFQQHNIEPDYYPITHFWYYWASIMLGPTVIMFGLVMLPRKISIAILIIIVTILATVTFGFATKTPMIGSALGKIPTDRAIWVKLYFDEECNKATQKDVLKFFQVDFWNVYDMLGWKRVEESLLHYLGYYNLTIYVVSVGYWDSDDAMTFAPFALQEAIQDSGQSALGEDGFLQYVTLEHEDFAIFVTLNGLSLRGLSIPNWHAMIIDGATSTTQGSVYYTHEICHQYNMLHCGNVCLMNPNWIDLKPPMCDECFAEWNTSFNW